MKKKRDIFTAGSVAKKLNVYSTVSIISGVMLFILYGTMLVSVILEFFGLLPIKDGTFLTYGVWVFPAVFLVVFPSFLYSIYKIDLYLVMSEELRLKNNKRTLV